MRVKIHARAGIPWQDDYRQRLTSGLKRHNIEIVQPDEQCDFRIVLGPHQQQYEVGSFLQVNRAFLGQSEWDNSDDHCVAIGWNGMNGKADFCLSEMDGDRWKRFLNPDEIKDWVLEKGLVVLGQADKGRCDFSLEDFYHSMHRNHPDHVFRPHPCHRTNRHEWSDTSVAMSLNTTASVDALINGNLVISFDVGNPVWAWTAHELGKGYYCDREEVFSVLGNCQFTRKEVENGDFLVQLMGKRTGKLYKHATNQVIEPTEKKEPEFNDMEEIILEDKKYVWTT